MTLAIVGTAPEARGTFYCGDLTAERRQCLKLGS
jgi:hypothetical protein